MIGGCGLRNQIHKVTFVHGGTAWAEFWINPSDPPKRAAFDRFGSDSSAEAIGVTGNIEIQFWIRKLTVLYRLPVFAPAEKGRGEEVRIIVVRNFHHPAPPPLVPRGEGA